MARIASVQLSLCVYVFHSNLQLTYIVNLDGPVTQIRNLGDLPIKCMI